MNAEGLATALKTVRENKGLTKHAVYVATHIRVSDSETPRKLGPSFLTVARIAKHYGVSLDTIAQMSGVM